MQYIQNIVFWLTAAMDAATTAITLGIIVFLICLFGIGLGVGRIWNAKWKLNASALGISCIMGLLAAILIMVHTAMGFVQETIVSPRVKETVKTNIVNDLANNNSLMKEAFKQALDTLKKTGENTDTLTTEEKDFSFTEDTNANKEKFLNSVIKTISGTAPQAQKDKAKKKLASLSDMAPFSYGYAPISRDADGDVAFAFNNQLADHDGKVGTENPYWFATIIKGMVDKSFEGLEKAVCQKIDSQRSSALILMIVLMLIQTALISWLAYTDIRPRRIQID